MKRKLSSLLAMVLAMTMVMGIGATAFAADPSEIDGWTDDYDSGMREITPDSGVLILVRFDLGAQGLGERTDKVYLNDEWLSGEDYFAPSLVNFEMGPCSKSDFETYVLPLLQSYTTETIKYVNRVTWDSESQVSYNYFYTEPYYEEHYGYTDPPGSNPKKASAPIHVHSFKWQTITAPTQYADGLEGEVCSCGATRNTQPLSAYGYALNQYATPMINAAKSGQTITFEFGEWNSFPKSFMAKLVDKSAQNVTFVFKYKWNHKAQTITIPAGTPIDLNFDWYGPAKMAELYGAY